MRLPVRKVTKTAAAVKAAKAAARSRPVRAVVVLAAAGGAVAAVRRRRARQAELEFGRPNESVPSHEALAGARQAAEAR
jgi:hypothetical protein